MSGNLLLATKNYGIPLRAVLGQGAARTLTADIDYALVLPLQVSGVPQSGDLARLAILMFTLDTALRRDVLGRRRAYSSVRCCR